MLSKVFEEVSPGNLGFHERDTSKGFHGSILVSQSFHQHINVELSPTGLSKRID